MQNSNNSNKKVLIVTLSVLLALLVYVSFRGENGDFDASKFVTNIVAALVVFVFVFLIVALIRKNSPTNQSNNTQMPPNPMDGIKNEILPQTSNKTFKDVAGLSEVKEELEEIVDFLKNPTKYKSFGIKLPKGVLLVGPPGVGKTLIAKAVAGEAGVPFFYESGASFAQIFVGMGPKKVRELFKKAKENAPSIIFIDEIDAVGKARGATRNDEREATLNQLLTEMDGFEESDDVIVIGATNKVEVLDEALLRAGRFDRRVYVDLPGLEDREEILKIYLKNKPFKGDIREIAKMTVGFNGASLASLVNEASIYALNHNKDFISNEDFLAVKDKVLVGKKKILSYTEQEKNILSYYQSAKAVNAVWLEVDFDKMTLVKDNFKEIDRELVSKSEIEAKIQVYLSGLVCVEDIFKEKYSNASEDIKKAKELARKMVEEYGMAENLLASEADIVEILNEAYRQTKILYLSQKDAILKVQKKLLENEIITKEEIKEIVNEIL